MINENKCIIGFHWIDGLNIVKNGDFSIKKIKKFTQLSEKNGLKYSYRVNKKTPSVSLYFTFDKMNMIGTPEIRYDNITPDVCLTYNIADNIIKNDRYYDKYSEYDKSYDDYFIKESLGPNKGVKLSDVKKCLECIYKHVNILKMFYCENKTTSKKKSKKIHGISSVIICDIGKIIKKVIKPQLDRVFTKHFTDKEWSIRSPLRKPISFYCSLQLYIVCKGLDKKLIDDY